MRGKASWKIEFLRADGANEGIPQSRLEFADSAAKRREGARKAITVNDGGSREVDGCWRAAINATAPRR